MSDAVLPPIVASPGTSAAEIDARALSKMRRRRWVVLFWQIAILAVALGAWEFTAQRGIIDSFFYSSPSAIAVRLKELLIEGVEGVSLWYHLYITMLESIIGFVMGSIGGIGAGIALGRNRMLGDIFQVYIKTLNAIPRVILAPIFALIFGYNIWAKVAVSFIMVFFVVFANAFQGVREADRAMIANAQILGASKWQVTRSVILPSAMSWIFASLHISFSFAIVGAIVSEFVIANAGIGFVIQLARGLHDTALMFAAILVVLVVVLIAEWLMTLVERRLARWRPAPFHEGGA